MAVRGPKPKHPDLKLVTGNPGHRPIAGAEKKDGDGGGDEPPAGPDMRETPLVPHRKLNKAQLELWKRFIDTAWWLTEHDVPKGYMWVCLQAEYDKKPGKMIAARLAQLRVLGSELGLDVAARSRMGVARGQKKDPTDKYFE
jgi:hypothetical protein